MYDAFNFNTEKQAEPTVYAEVQYTVRLIDGSTKSNCFTSLHYNEDAVIREAESIYGKEVIRVEDRAIKFLNGRH